MTTLIGLLLAAAVALGFFLRRSFARKSTVRQKDKARKESAKRELEQDRLDCLELARGLDRQLDGTARPKAAAAVASTDSK